jgi:hypothetical protein
MKTKSVNVLLKHKFFLYGMIFLSVLQLVNFYKAGSLTCLGAFGVAYYLGCLYTKNKALCLLFANLVATFVLGCEKNLEGFREGVDKVKSPDFVDAPPDDPDDPDDPADPADTTRTGQGGNVQADDESAPTCSTFTEEEKCQANQCVWDDTKEEGKCN